MKNKIKYPRIKVLSFHLRQVAGRSSGRITTPRRCTNKRSYRFLDIKRKYKPQVTAHIVAKYVYDPNRTARISILMYDNSLACYILASNYHWKQETVGNLLNAQFKRQTGFSNFLRHLNSGTIIHNIELTPGHGGRLVKSAGNSAILLTKDRRSKNNYLLKLRSGEFRFIKKNLIASVGVVSNHAHFLTHLKNAGSARHRGIRPRVRPSAMNPVDHPMGGRTKGGIFSCNAKRFLSTNVSTRKKKPHAFILVPPRHRRLKNRNHRIRLRHI